jgi:hypothetical protein
VIASFGPRLHVHLKPAPGTAPDVTADTIMIVLKAHPQQRGHDDLTSRVFRG